MIITIITQAVVAKGYGDSPAVTFSENGNAARFRIGKRRYDSSAPENTRWINLNVKAFGQQTERIRKMQLKEGCFINLTGRLDEDVWTDKEGQKRSQLYIVLDEIEYASGKSQSRTDAGSQSREPAKQASAPAAAPEKNLTGDSFTGFEAFGTMSFFDGF